MTPIWVPQTHISTRFRVPSGRGELLYSDVSYRIYHRPSRHPIPPATVGRTRLAYRLDDGGITPLAPRAANSSPKLSEHGMQARTHSISNTATGRRIAKRRPPATAHQRRRSKAAASPTPIPHHPCCVFRVARTPDEACQGGRAGGDTASSFPYPHACCNRPPAPQSTATRPFKPACPACTPRVVPQSRNAPP